MKKMYACLKCGFVYEGKTKRVREDVDRHGSGRMGSSFHFHGWRTYRTCPECGREHTLKTEIDENHDYYKEYEKRKMIDEYRRELEKKSEDDIEKNVKKFKKEVMKK